MPDGNDAERYTCEVALPDDTRVHIRPIRADDGDGLLDLMRRLSKESLYMRFFTIPKPDPKVLDYLTHVDYENHFALVGEVGGRIAAVARYVRDRERPDIAEIALTVADDLQGHHLGTELFGRLAEAARAHGIRAFEADILGENWKLLRMLARMDRVSECLVERGVLRVTIPTDSLKNIEAEELRDREIND